MFAGIALAALMTLNPHPRLYWRADAVSRIAADARLAQWHRKLEERASVLTTLPTLQYTTDQRGNILAISRDALERIPTLSGLYLIDRDPTKLARARAELLSVANFPDWGAQRHFLDAAEMALAVAIGYDWLYEVLSSQDRAIIRTALVEKALLPGQEQLRSKEWWTLVDHNWNLVCNGGLAVAALAVADEEPALAQSVLTLARASMNAALPSFAPDGGWMEGPDYWNYATKYATFFLAAMESAFSSPSTFDAASTPGLSETGFFWLHTVGPTGLLFNFSDSRSEVRQSNAPQVLWLAKRFHHREFAAPELATDHPTMFHLLWYDPAFSRRSDLQLSRTFRAAGVSTFRGHWNDPRATFLAIKGGKNSANHSHLDLGTFVLDALGQRWATDPGRGDYAKPGYFQTKDERWKFFETSTAAHNTILIEGANQDPKGSATLVAFQKNAGRSFATYDLTAGYAGNLRSFLRTARLLRGRDVEIEDTLELAHPADVRWQMLTDATIDLAGRRAVLKQGGERLAVALQAPRDAVFSTSEVPGTEKTALVIALPKARGPLRISVRFSP